MDRTQYNDLWGKTAAYRRLLLLFLIGLTTIVAGGYMMYVLPHRGQTSLEIVIVIFFALLFAWISIGFWTSLIGFWVLLRRKDKWNPARFLNGLEEAQDLSPTAVLMPIYNEDTERVFQGLSAVFTSLKQTGKADAFDFFVLSDSKDPDLWVQEEIAWNEVCRSLNAFRRIFYRHRMPNIKRKSGNIADFCRRWGGNYSYMIVLDADSIMSGTTLVNMVRIMDADASIGILQTTPMPVGKESLLARSQQFAGHMYSRMFSAGLHFWQLGDAQYWGHNAIIRIQPFMQHCALPRLSGSPPLGGDILSHDFVEAALMRRAGWGVWLAYDLEGSYEEPPPTLLDELSRDRRWCQGNLQHLRLLFTKGLFPAHRYLFLNGAMSYISALLWFVFLCLSTAEAFKMALFEPNYFPRPGSLFPSWPVWNPAWMFLLLLSTIVILFLPKLLSLFLTVVIQRRGREFGGIFRAAFSLITEVVISTLTAPIRMLAHSKFVVVTLLGGQIEWTPPSRNKEGISWKEAFNFSLGGSALAFLWGTALYFVNRAFFWWLVPVLVPLLLAAPIMVLSSKSSVGRFLGRLGLLLIPAELKTPAELRDFQKRREYKNKEKSLERRGTASGFVRAVVEPAVNCLHNEIQRGERKVSESIVKRHDQLIEKALRSGPHALSAIEKKQLLTNAASLKKLHEKVWELPDGMKSRMWGL